MSRISTALIQAICSMGLLYKETSRLLWLSRCATSPPAVSYPEQQLETGTRFGQCDKENTRVCLFAKELVPLVTLKPWQNIKGRPARSEFESEFSQRSSVAVALADACLQTDSGRVKVGDTHVCVRSAQILKKAGLSGNRGRGYVVWGTEEAQCNNCYRKAEKPETRFCARGAQKLPCQEMFFLTVSCGCNQASDNEWCCGA